MALRICRSALRVVATPRLVTRSTRLATSSLLRVRYNSTATALKPEEPLLDDAPLLNDTLAAEEPAAATAMAFAELEGKVTPETLRAITVAPFHLTNMTPVQEEVLSLLPDLARPPSSPTETRDLLVRAKTGTGKTLAFLVPAIEARIHDVSQQPEDKQGAYARETVGALIVSPTRELAMQIAAEALRLSTHHKGFQVSVFVGGNSKRDQMRSWMFNRRDIVVATPGRLRDLMNSEPEVARGLKTAKMLILDEVDTMLDIGFREDMEAVKRELGNGTEQTFLFSATVSPKIQQVASTFLAKGYKYINTVVQEDSPTHDHIPQYSTILPSAADQIPTVMKLIAHDQLKNPKESKIIVFLPTTRMVQLYTTLIRQLAKYAGAGNGVIPAGKNTDVLEIHSKKAQESRSAASSRFRAAKGGASILVTSDVSARGVDYPGVTRVIQVGIPSSADQYIHRVGRTGRGSATNTGRGDLVLLPWETGFLTWQLTNVKLKSITVNQITEETAELAKVFDADKASGARHLTNRPYLPILQEIDGSVTDLHQKMDPEAIRETFVSQLGYYISKSTELRISKEVILDGLKNWAVEGYGLPVAPYVSAQFLKKIGMSEGKQSRFGRDSGAPREDFRGGDRPPWMGRGRSDNNKFERRESGGEGGYQRGGGYQGGRDREGGGGYQKREGSFRGKPSSSEGRWGSSEGEQSRTPRYGKPSRERSY